MSQPRHNSITALYTWQTSGLSGAYAYAPKDTHPRRRLAVR